MQSQTSQGEFGIYLFIYLYLTQSINCPITIIKLSEAHVHEPEPLFVLKRTLFSIVTRQRKSIKVLVIAG